MIGYLLDSYFSCMERMKRKTSLPGRVREYVRDRIFCCTLTKHPGGYMREELNRLICLDGDELPLVWD